MKKVLVHIGFGCISILAFIIDLFIFIIYHPILRFIEHVKTSNKHVILILPQSFREKLNLWDSAGYKNNPLFIKELNLKQVLSWTIEEQATLVHEYVFLHLECCIKIPAHQACEGLPGFFNNIILGENPIIERYNLPLTKSFELRTARDQVSVTEIGNLAYIALFHKSAEVNEYAFNLLYSIKKHYNIQ